MLRSSANVTFVVFALGDNDGENVTEGKLLGTCSPTPDGAFDTVGSSVVGDPDGSALVSLN